MKPEHCPNGHPLGPGQASLSWAYCAEPCGGPEHGHHRIYCGTCGVRLWLGHSGAVWEQWDGYVWVGY